jgi:hypothetical protein
MPQLTRKIIMEKRSTEKQPHEVGKEQKTDKPQEFRKPRFRLVRLEERVTPNYVVATGPCSSQCIGKA